MKIVQPRGTVRVNLDNPLARYMEAAFCGSFGWVDPKGRAEATAAPRLMVAGQGIGQSFTEATVATGPHYNETPALSLFVMFRKEVTTYGPTFGFGWSRFYSENNGATTDFFRNVNGEQVRVGCDGPTGSMWGGALCTALWTHDGTTGIGGYRAWIQGVESSVYNVVSGSPVNYGPGASIYVGGASGWLLHTVTLAVAFSANLANVNGAVAMLHDDPWSLFESDALPRKIFLPPPVTSTTKRWHPTPVVRTTQPTDRAEVDWSNPITRGLLWAYLPLGPMSQKSGKITFTPDVDVEFAGTKRDGRALALRNRIAYYTKAVTIAGDEGIYDSGGAMALVIANLTTASDQYNGLLSGTVSNTFGIEPGTWKLRLVAAASTRMVSTNPIPVARAVVAANYTQSGPMALFIDGAVESEGTDVGYGFGAVSRIGTSDGGGNLNCDVFLVAKWVRTLSKAEHASFAANPWQIFKPDSRLAFFEHQAGSAYPTLSLATVIDILQTSARPRVTITVP